MDYDVAPIGASQSTLVPLIVRSSRSLFLSLLVVLSRQQVTHTLLLRYGWHPSVVLFVDGGRRILLVARELCETIREVTVPVRLGARAR